MLSIPKSTDEALWDAWMSTYHLPILSVADKLNLFSYIHTNADHHDICETLNISTHALDALTGPLIALGFLTQDINKFYLTPIAETYLLPESPYYWGSILEKSSGPGEYQAILDSVINSATQLNFNGENFTESWESGELTISAAESFTRKMHATIFAPAVQAIQSGLFQDTTRLLDAGGGSGCFSIAYVKQYPGHNATIFDLPTVCQVAEGYINQFDSNATITTHAGNFFIEKDWPKNCDGVLLSQILHDWPIEKCKLILKNAYEALPKGGKIYIHEMLLDSDKANPLAVACFNLLMFINHQSQQFTKTEITDLLIQANFKDVCITKTFGYYSIISAIK